MENLSQSAGQTAALYNSMINSGGSNGGGQNSLNGTGGGGAETPNVNGSTSNNNIGAASPHQQMQQAAQHQQLGLMGGGGASALGPMMGAGGSFNPGMSLGSLNPHAISQMAGLVGSANGIGGNGMPSMMGMMGGGMNSPGQPNAALLMAAMQGNNGNMSGMTGAVNGGAGNPMNALLNPNLMHQAAAAIINNSGLGGNGGSPDGMGGINGAPGTGGMGQMNSQQLQQQQNLMQVQQQQQQQQNMQMQQMMMMQQMQQQMQSNPVLSGMMGGTGPLNSPLGSGGPGDKVGMGDKNGGMCGLPQNALSSLFPGGGLGGMGGLSGNPSIVVGSGVGGDQGNPLGALMPQSMMGGNPILSGNGMGSMGLGCVGGMGGMGVGSDIGIAGSKSEEDAATGGSSVLGGAPQSVSDCQYRDYSKVSDEIAFSARNGGAMSSSKSKSNSSANFPSKLHEILSRDDITDIIAWAPHGRSWRVLKPKAFEEKIIPQYFRHGKYNSFTRQVNGWGFRRITQGPDHNSYYHEYFLRGLPHLCKRMRRLTAAGLSKNDNISRTEPDFYRLAKLAPLSENNKNNSSNGENNEETNNINMVESNNSDIAPRPASNAGLNGAGGDNANGVNGDANKSDLNGIKQEDFTGGIGGNGVLSNGVGDKNNPNSTPAASYLNSLQQLNSMQHLLQAQYNTTPSSLLNQDKSKGAGNLGCVGGGGLPNQMQFASLFQTVAGGGGTGGLGGLGGVGSLPLSTISPTTPLANTGISVGDGGNAAAGDTGGDEKFEQSV